MMVALASVGPAAAQSPVAVVVDVTGGPAGLGFMDYVAAGRVIRLGPQGTLVLSYMTSCVRETISGGTVTIGATRSEVADGTVARRTLACGAGRMTGSRSQASGRAGQVFRGRPSPRPAPAD